MPTEPRRLLLASTRARRLPALEPSTLVLLPYPRGVRRRDPAPPLAAARPEACPIRSASITDARIDASIPPGELRPAVAECARILNDEGRLEVRVLLRAGTRGSLRLLFAWLFHLPPPPTADTVSRLLFDHGFDRIEQRIDGSLGRFRARRLPGRASAF